MLFECPSTASRKPRKPGDRSPQPGPCRKPSFSDHSAIAPFEAAMFGPLDILFAILLLCISTGIVRLNSTPNLPAYASLVIAHHSTTIWHPCAIPCKLHPEGPCARWRRRRPAPRRSGRHVVRSPFIGVVPLQSAKQVSQLLPDDVPREAHRGTDCSVRALKCSPSLNAQGVAGLYKGVSAC